jgi:glycosyltransferase involved in cell wall biosynthesis
MELPAVSTRFSGIPELVVEGETGLLVDTNDHDGAVEALRALLNDPARRQRMGTAGRRRVRQAFTIEASTAALDETFRSLIAARRPAAAAAIYAVGLARRPESARNPR